MNEPSEFFWQCDCSIGSVHPMAEARCRACKQSRKHGRPAAIDIVKETYKDGIETNHISEGMHIIRRYDGSTYKVLDNKKGIRRMVECISGMPVIGDRGSMYAHEFGQAEITPGHYVIVILTKKQRSFMQKIDRDFGF